jgi:hypothetical protein
MADALVGRATAYVLSHEDSAVRRFLPAVVTPRHEGRCVGVPLMAAGFRNLGGITPRFAEKRGVLNHADHQHE